MNSFENILLEQRGDGIALLTINRAAQRNALNQATLEELRHALQELDEDATTRAVILTGAGDECFATSGETFGNRFPNGTFEAFEKLEEQIKDSRKPIIAAINGLAAGDGYRLALTCPLRLAAANAKIDYRETGFELIYSEIEQFIPWVVPEAAAESGGIFSPDCPGHRQEIISLLREIHLNYQTGNYHPVTAQQALTVGLILSIADTQESLIEQSIELAKRIVLHAPLAIQFALATVNRGLRWDEEDALYLESALFSLCFATEDAKEGTRAFLEKRVPKFTGR